MSRKKISKICPNCGLNKLIRKDVNFCSIKCFHESHTKYPIEIRSCKFCGNKFRVYLSQIAGGWGKGVYCSRKCYFKTPKTQEFKKKISKAFSGSNHPNWKGGIMKGRKERNQSIYKEWRNEIFSVDKYTCQFCGARNGHGETVKFEAHHILPWDKFPEMRFSPDNGTTLCQNCHKITRLAEYVKIRDKNLYLEENGGEE